MTIKQVCVVSFSMCTHGTKLNEMKCKKLKRNIPLRIAEEGKKLEEKYGPMCCALAISTSSNEDYGLMFKSENFPT